MHRSRTQGMFPAGIPYRPGQTRTQNRNSEPGMQRRGATRVHEQEAGRRDSLGSSAQGSRM